MTMLLGEFAALFAGTALLEGPLLAPRWVRFFVRRRAIAVFLWCDVLVDLKVEIFEKRPLFLRSQSEDEIR
jgi:hypothetical protein